ncbi:MAG TPA: hypothetical protein VLW55_20610, partial [Burkholderiaceae bacterium]|nr:hypothetical protein [Burkholderiaceae bacterium]
MSKLTSFCGEENPLRQNELLFSWLSDDTQREELYDELRAGDFPVLRFKSVLRSDDDFRWPNQDVYLLTRKDHIETALKQYSVEPYRGLDSGGRFMLGLDNRVAHWKQNDAAVAALCFTDREIKACASEAFRRAAVLPLKDPGFKFDLAGLRTFAGIKGPPGLAAAAAIHFSLLLFGFRDESYGAIAALAVGAYFRLVYQIIGRHFSEDSGLPAVDSAKADEIVQELKDEIRLSVERVREERPKTQEQKRP